MDESVVPVTLVSVEKIKIFLYQNTNCPTEVLDVVEKAKNCLEILQAYLRDSEDQTDGSGLRMDQKVCIDIAHQIENVLDEFMFELVRHLLHSNKLPLKIGQSIRKLPLKISVGGANFSQVREASQRKLSIHIESTVSLLEGKQRKSGLTIENVSGAGLRSRRSDQLTKRTLKEDEAVGFEKLKETIIEQLMEQDPRLSTIGVVGMGGCGKTTLAKIVYESIRVREHFDCQAWVDASHPLRYNDILSVLIDMLGKFELNSEEESAETDKRAKLRLLLQEKKFLIVLDDIWSHQDWSHIQQALAKAGVQGSRIVITTRNSHIASFSVKYIHDLTSGLSEDGAWKLFCKKAFHNSKGKSPDVLEKWPETFVKLCEGVPLAISTFGTWLSMKKPHPGTWRKLYDHLGSELCKDDSDLSVLSRNLQLSYIDLPSHLKSCFLYLSMFPEDYSISRERLLRLWVAEGFVMPERGITVEQVAEGYLNELIARNLVVATVRESDGGRVRRCRVLHLVRQINISRQKSFTTVLDQNYKPSRTGENIIRRVSVDKGPIKIMKGMTSCIRSFLLFGQASSLPELQIVFKTSKFLKVLDLNGAVLNKFPKSVVGLSLLRYLSLRHTQIKFVPNSIGKLRFMETLDLKHTLVSKLPQGICKLERLRHLLVFGKNVGSGGVTISARKIGALTSIQKLSFIKVETNRRILKALGELIGLRKLGLTDLKKENGKELCGSIVKMQNLSTLDVRSISEDEYLDLDHMNYPLVAPLYLQHLYLRGRLLTIPRWIPELTSLTKIGLKWSKLKARANPFEEIQALPNLIELDLVDYYTGNMLIFKAQTFLKLVKLTINLFEKLTLVVVEPGAMPSLENLDLWRCQNLKELPVGIGGLFFLKEFLLYDMPAELIAKLQKNGEDRQLVKHIGVIHSYYKGNDGSFTKFIDVSPSKWSSES